MPQEPAGHDRGDRFGEPEAQSLAGVAAEGESPIGDREPDSQACPPAVGPRDVGFDHVVERCAQDPGAEPGHDLTVTDVDVGRAGGDADEDEGGGERIVEAELEALHDSSVACPARARSVARYCAFVAMKILRLNRRALFSRTDHTMEPTDADPVRKRAHQDDSEFGSCGEEMCLPQAWMLTVQVRCGVVPITFDLKDRDAARSDRGWG